MTLLEYCNEFLLHAIWNLVPWVPDHNERVLKERVPVDKDIGWSRFVSFKASQGMKTWISDANEL